MSGCELTGKKTMFGNNVSHSERKTRRKFKLNKQRKAFLSKALNVNIRFNICASVIKTIDKSGGIDDYLLNTSDELLSNKAKKIKLEIKKAHIVL